MTARTQPPPSAATLEVAAAAHTRTGAIFMRALRDNLTGILAWGVGYSVIILMVVLLYPAFSENNTLLGMVRSLGLLNSLDNRYVNVESMTSFPGYLAIQALTWAPLIFSIYIVPQALGVAIREEERGTLDILLSTPIPRWRFLVEKSLAVVASLLLILLMMWLTIVISTSLFEGTNIPIINATAGIWHIVPISLAVFAITLWISVAARTSRMAGGLAALFIIMSYFVRVITEWFQTVEWVNIVRKLSIFSHYGSLAVLTKGFQWQMDFVLLAVAAAFFALALRQFQERDIGV